MRSLAFRLLDHAARVMPLSRREWVRAMRAELAHIPTPGGAAAFALGCLRVSYMERLQDVMTIARLTRWAVAAYALVGAGCYLLATALVGLIKASPHLRPEDLGRDGHTAERLSFLRAYPTWQVAAFAAIAVLLTLGAVQLVRRRPDALPMLGSGVAVAALIAILDREAVGWPLAWSGAWLVPLMCLAPVWWLSRRAPDLKPAP